MSPQIRRLPQNLEAEQALLGAMLTDPEGVIPGARNTVSPADFLNTFHAKVCESIYADFDANKVVDMIAIADKVKTLHKTALNEMGKLVEACMSPYNAKRYAELVVQASGRRDIIKQCQEAIDMAYKRAQDDLGDINNDVLKAVNDGIRAAGSGKRSIEAADIVSRVYDQLNKGYNAADDTKLYTGLIDLDALTAGLHGQELTIVGARPGAGKSMFAVHLAQELARKKNKCLIVSREMSSESLVKRMISALSGINGQVLRQPKRLNDNGGWEKVGTAAAQVITDGIRIDDESATVQEVRALCRMLHDKGELDVLFVDYLTLMRTQRKCESRRVEVEDVTWQLKEISKEFDIPVVVLAQLNRASVLNDREPELSDLRETGAIEQDADNVLFLHIPKSTPLDQEIVEVKVIIAKQRNGPVGYVTLRQHKKLFRFMNAIRPEDAQEPADYKQQELESQKSRRRYYD